MAETSYTLWMKAREGGDKRSFVQYNKDLSAFFAGYQNALNSSTNATIRQRAVNQYLANVRGLGK